jgi:N-acyl-L-homoserine lactone synthetase
VPRGWLTTDAARTVMEVVRNDGTVEDAAAAVGVSRSAVKRALRRWGVRVGRRGPVRDVYSRAAVIDAVRRGNATCREVGRAMGFTVHRARQIVKELVGEGILERTGGGWTTRLRVGRKWTDARRKT